MDTLATYPVDYCADDPIGDIKLGKPVTRHYNRYERISAHLAIWIADRLINTLKWATTGLQNHKVELIKELKRK
ncbi:MAG: hypothetical protein V4440_04465 [Pseudomonadota bacterium]